MAFFDELTKKAQAYAEVAAEKAKDVAATATVKAKEVKDTTKANMEIATVKHEMEKNYRAIGEWFATNYDVETAPDAIKDVLAAIAEEKAKIAELEASKPKKEEVEEAVDAVVEEVEEATEETVGEAPAEAPVEE